MWPTMKVLSVIYTLSVALMEHMDLFSVEVSVLCSRQTTRCFCLFRCSLSDLAVEDSEILAMLWTTDMTD